MTLSYNYLMNARTKHPFFEVIAWLMVKYGHRKIGRETKQNIASLVIGYVGRKKIMESLRHRMGLRPMKPYWSFSRLIANKQLKKIKNAR